MPEVITQPNSTTHEAVAHVEDSSVVATSVTDQTTQLENNPGAVAEDGTIVGNGSDVGSYEEQRLALLSGKTPVAKAVVDEQVTDPPGNTYDTVIVDELEDTTIPTLESDGSLPKHLKVKPKSAVDLEVFSLYKQGYPMETALEMATIKFPDSPEAQARKSKAAAIPAPVTEIPATSTEGDSTVLSVQQIQKDIEAAEDSLDDAYQLFDNDAIKAARAKLRTLNQQLPAAIVREEQVISQEQEAHNAQFAEALAEAEGLYPDLKNPSSALAITASEIQKKMQASNDPLFYTPESALIIASRAARKLNIKPGSPAAAVAAPATTVANTTTSSQASTPAPATTQNRRPPAAAMIAGGNARTAQPGPQTLDISAVKNSDDYESIRKRALGI